MAAKEIAGAAIIVRNDAAFTVTDKTHAIYKRTVEMRITENGKRYASFSCQVNNGSSKLKSFSGVIKDADGKITKIKKSDLRYTEYSEGLADSFGTWFYSPDIIHYPATVTYTYEKQYADAILGYDAFVPQPYGDGVSLTEASYTLTVPSKDCFTFKQLNMPDIKPEHTTTDAGEVYVWKIGPLPPLKAEPFSPPLSSRMPAVLFSATGFSFEGKEGSARDWTAVGNWLISLTEDRDVPPQDLKDKVLQLTEGAESEMERIKRLYEYLGESTRYVSIQLGLGGLRPIEPEKVFRNKFGDCKALSFFMQTMLRCCGIDSHYVIINMGDDRMMPDFPSLGTANHAILAVPMAKDTLWLECTNPEVPLGYVHSEISGNHALVVKKDGSYVTRLPKPSDESNRDSLEVIVDLKADGSAEAIVREKAEMDFWSKFHSLEKMPENERMNDAKSSINLPRVEVKDIMIDCKATSKPSCLMTYNVNADTYASVTGTRLFIPINPFRNPESETRSSKRLNDLYFKSGNVQTDSVVLNVPEGYSVEAYPEGYEFGNEFGSIHFNCSHGTNGYRDKLLLTFRLSRNSGTFPKSKYENYMEFRNAITRVFGAKIVLVKKSSSEQP